MTNLKVGGVPEHFNYPWYVTLKNKEYSNHNINLRWQDFPGGTGEMCAALRSGEVDIAIVLTEGIIKDLTENQHSSIVQIFVKSPLIWGIHVDGKSEYNLVADLENKIFYLLSLSKHKKDKLIKNSFNHSKKFRLNIISKLWIKLFKNI